MSRKILVVDDDPDNVGYLRDVLEDHGYTTFGASDGVEGLAQARGQKPDLILLDLMMPNKSGIGMFQELKSSPDTQDIPVVIVTGVSQATGVDFRNFMFKQSTGRKEKGVDTAGQRQYTVPSDYIEKPVDPDELIRVVKKVLSD
jgi:two-component system cell cycle response regulator DivK